MSKGQSVCATVSRRQFLSLSREVRRNGRSAIMNRMSSALLLREDGDVEAAEKAENEAEVMTAIAERIGFKL